MGIGLGSAFEPLTPEDPCKIAEYRLLARLGEGCPSYPTTTSTTPVSTNPGSREHHPVPRLRAHPRGHSRRPAKAGHGCAHARADLTEAGGARPQRTRPAAGPQPQATDRDRQALLALSGTRLPPLQRPQGRRDTAAAPMARACAASPRMSAPPSKSAALRTRVPSPFTTCSPTRCAVESAADIWRPLSPGSPSAA